MTRLRFLTAARKWASTSVAHSIFLSRCVGRFFDVLRVLPTNSIMVITGIIDEQIIEEKYNQRYDLKQWICNLKQTLILITQE